MDLLVREVDPCLPWILKNGHSSVGVSQLGMCEGKVRIGLKRLFEKTDCGFHSLFAAQYALVKCVNAFQIKLVSDRVGGGLPCQSGLLRRVQLQAQARSDLLRDRVL